ncbi:MAG: citrate/2-methylcitrate synthase [Bacteroidales bacterium]
MELYDKLSAHVHKVSQIEKDLFSRYNVKRGLRNADHSGVLVGLTNIGDVIGYDKVDGKIIPVEGQLYYRGINVNDLVKGFQADQRHGFEETIYLLLSGKLPNQPELKEFTEELSELRELPPPFTKNMILSMRGRNVMNMLARSVLVTYTLDEDPENYSLKNVIKQSMNLIAKFPAFVVYSYYGMLHSFFRRSLVIRHPEPHLSIAENFLHMLKGDDYTSLEADIIDLALVLHAEHGGGNNSSFTTRVVSSSGTDTYSAIAAAIGSLKGGLHGGANLKVIEMMENIKENVSDWKDEEEVKAYLTKILKCEAFDKSGKIYGIGHAIYTLSDPRAVLLKEKARSLAIEKNRLDEFELYALIEKLAPEVFGTYKGPGAKVICPNVDFYSGFVYDCIHIPRDIYTPVFAIARIAGWCAHRLEEVTFTSKRIIRPAYKNVSKRSIYVPLEERIKQNVTV